jgi:N-glycosylase/DNA lyase
MAVHELAVIGSHRPKPEYGFGATGSIMERGAIDVANLAGPFDLQATVESGQSYLWNRADGRTYEDLHAYGGDAWYETVVDPIPGVVDERALIRVRQEGGVRDGTLHWESSVDAVPLLEHLFRLDDDLDAILDATPDLPLLKRAYDAYEGMRLTRDPVFPCLISFICSAQMRVARIHGMQRRLRETYGDAVTVDGEEYRAFPTPDQLASRTESELRDLSLGYRAPYVQRTAEMIASGEADPREAANLPYEEARESLTKFVGVGDKVADCVLLFSLGFLEAVPLDTWIRTTIEEYYPDCERGNYTDTSRAIREQFGGEFAGYAQTYVFYHLRAGGE